MALWLRHYTLLHQSDGSVAACGDNRWGQCNEQRSEQTETVIFASGLVAMDLMKHTYVRTRQHGKHTQHSTRKRKQHSTCKHTQHNTAHSMQHTHHSTRTHHDTAQHAAQRNTLRCNFGPMQLCILPLAPVPVAESSENERSCYFLRCAPMRSAWLFGVVIVALAFEPFKQAHH